MLKGSQQRRITTMQRIKKYASGSWIRLPIRLPLALLPLPFRVPTTSRGRCSKSPIAPLGEAQGQFRSNREGPPSPAFSSATNRITTSSAPQVAGTQPSDRGIGVGTREPAIAAGRLLPMQRGEDVGRAQGDAPAASVTNAERWGLPPFAGVPATMTLWSREEMM
jgi:hypothetical protein